MVDSLFFKNFFFYKKKLFLEKGCNAPQVGVCECRNFHQFLLFYP